MNPDEPGQRRVTWSGDEIPDDDQRVEYDGGFWVDREIEPNTLTWVSNAEMDEMHAPGLVCANDPLHLEHDIGKGCINGPAYQHWLVAWREEEAQRVANAGARSPTSAWTDRAPQGTTRYGRRALEAEAGRIALAVDGSRNDQLNRSAFALGQLVAGRELDLDEAYDSLQVAALRSGLSRDETAKTLDSGLASGMKTPRTAQR